MFVDGHEQVEHGQRGKGRSYFPGGRGGGWRWGRGNGFEEGLAERGDFSTHETPPPVQKLPNGDGERQK